jgi:hypothetical protein
MKLKNNSQFLFYRYTSLMNNERFIHFGFNKVIITSSVINHNEFSFHLNVLITNNTTLDEYFNQVIDYIELYYDSGNSHGINIIPAFKVKEWNMDNDLNKSIKFTRDNKKQKMNSKKKLYHTFLIVYHPLKIILSLVLLNQYLVWSLKL